MDSDVLEHTHESTVAAALPPRNTRWTLRCLLVALAAIVIAALGLGGLGCGGSGDFQAGLPTYSLQAVALEPPSPTMPAGTSLVFKVTETFSDGSVATSKPVQLVDAGVLDAASSDSSPSDAEPAEGGPRRTFVPLSWSSSDPTIATVDTTGLVHALKSGTTTIKALEPTTGVSGTAKVTVSDAVVTSIAVTPPTATVPKGTSENFVATGTYSDMSTKDISAIVKWSSSDPAIAKVASGGQATGIDVGSVHIVATDPESGTTASAALTVSDAVLKSIAVTPTAPSVPKGVTQQFTATGTYSDATTKDITDQVSWTSSSAPIAVVSNATGTKGIASAVGVGAAVIGAKDPATGLTGSTTMNVTSATLKSIAVTPTSPAIPKGTTQQFTATGTFSDGSTRDITTAVTWASSDTGIATVSVAPGSQGLATAITAGTTTISATDASTGVTGSTTLAVGDAVLKSISVTPPTPTIPKGITQQFTATGTFSDGSTKDLTTAVTWASSAISVATISNASGSHGLATGLGTGAATITATDPSSSIAGSTTLTVSAAVLESLAITPTSPSVPKATNQQFTATGTFSDGSTKDLTTAVTWSSSNTTVAAISNAGGSQGLSSAISGGSTIIAATDPATGISTSTIMKVTSAVLQSIAVTPASSTTPKGTTQQLTATGTFSDGTTKDITTSVTWTSSNTAVATISNASGSEGLATGVAAGTTTITAADPATGLSGAASLRVTSAVLQSIAVTSAGSTIPKGTTQQFTATGTYSDGTTKDITTSVTWTSSDTAVATISNASGSKGLATGVAAGTTTITAADSGTGLSGSASLGVTSAVLQSIAVTPASSKIPKGTTQQFVATGTYSDGTTKDITTSVTWTSSKTAVATISNAAGSQGLATGVAVGTTKITATDPGTGVSGSASLRVTSAVLQSIAVTPASATTPKGTTQQFVATGTYSDGTTKDITTSVTWTSSNTAVATISNASGSQGLATGVAAGTTKITATDSGTGVSGSASLRVTSAVLQSIAVTPASSTIPKGTTQQFTATGTYSDGTTKDITTSVTWTSSNTAVATISNASGSQGLATGVATGTTKITATDPGTGIAGSTGLTVSPPVLKSITVTPVNPSTPRGTTLQFTATGLYSDGSTKDITSSVNWSSSNTSVATISTTGLAKASNFRTGATTITAADASTGITGSTTLTVT